MLIKCTNTHNETVFINPSAVSFIRADVTGTDRRPIAYVWFVNGESVEIAGSADDLALRLSLPPR